MKLYKSGQTKLKIVMKIQFPISSVTTTSSGFPQKYKWRYSIWSQGIGFQNLSGFYQGNIDRYMAEHSNLWIPSSEYFHKSPKFAKCLKLGQPSSHQRPFQNLRCHFMQFPFSVHLASTESKFGFDANCVCLLGYMCINHPNILQLKTYWVA